MSFVSNKGKGTKVVPENKISSLFDAMDDNPFVLDTKFDREGEGRKDIS